MKTDSRRMRLIEKPAAGASVLVAIMPSGPVILGAGPRSYRCAACDTTLLRNVEYNAVQYLTFQCRCGAFNEIPASDQAN